MPRSKAADEIEAELRSQGATEVASSRVGALAMAKLRELDQIAYIRFASVYQSFEDLEALKREVDSLYAERGDETIAIDVRPATAVRTARPARPGRPADERPVRPRHPGRARGRRVAHRPVRPGATSSRRRSTSTSTAASGSSATTATRSSTSARRSPT